MSETVQAFQEVSIRQQISRPAASWRIGSILRGISFRNPKGVEEERLVDLNADIIHSNAPYGIKLGGEEYRGLPLRADAQQVTGNKIYRAALEQQGKPQGEIVWVRVDGGVVGTMLTPDGGMFSIEPLESTNTQPRHVLRKLSTHDANECVILPSRTATLQNAERENNQKNLLGVPNNRVIDVMVLYTPQAKAKMPDIDARIAASVANTNKAIAGAGYQGVMWATHTGLIDSLPKGVDANTFLSAVRQNETVRRLLENERADLVQVVTDEFAGGGGGIGEQPGLYSALSLVGLMGTSGPHEWGHNLGLAHNREDGAPWPPIHTAGWGHRDATRRICCVMSYTQGGHYVRQISFSNAATGFGGPESDAKQVFGVTFENTASTRVPTDAPQPSGNVHVIHLPMIGR